MNEQKTSMPLEGHEHAICSTCKQLWDRPDSSDDDMCITCREHIKKAAEKVRLGVPVKVTLPQAMPSDDINQNAIKTCDFCKRTYQGDLDVHWKTACPVREKQQQLSQSSKSFNLDDCLFDVYVIMNYMKGLRFREACEEATSMIEARDSYLREIQEDQSDVDSEPS